MFGPNGELHIVKKRAQKKFRPNNSSKRSLGCIELALSLLVSTTNSKLVDWSCHGGLAREQSLPAHYTCHYPA